MTPPTLYRGQFAREMPTTPPRPEEQDYPNGLVAVPPRWRPAALIPSLGNGRCYRCRKPWHAIRAHAHPVLWRTTAHIDGRLRPTVDGQVALCGGCWEVSSKEEILRAHAWATACTDTVQHWPVIEATIRLNIADGPHRRGGDPVAEAAEWMVNLDEHLQEVEAGEFAPEPGSWQANHVEAVVRRLAGLLGTTPLTGEWGHGMAEVLGQRERLEGPLYILYLRHPKLPALYWHARHGWLALPPGGGDDDFQPLVPRGGHTAPRPSTVADDVVDLVRGERTWPLFPSD